MKQTSWFTFFLLFACAALLLPACSKSTEPSGQQQQQQQDLWKFDATLSGTQEVPANASTATGKATGTYEAITNLLSYTINWSGLSGTATAGHFHAPAAAGANASPLIYFNLQNSGTSGVASGSITLTDAQEVDLLAGKFYANIHAPAPYAGGEIRGQLVLTR